MANTPVFELNDVSYAYRPGEDALRGINIAIAAGERVALLGPNGCGKSTLQKVLAGLIFPAGRVIAFGRPVTAQAMRDDAFAIAFRRRVGFVFQNADVQIFCASVLDEIMFGPLALGLAPADARRRAEEIMAFVGIAPLADRMPHHLSGGEKKKVAIAAVLAVNPDVLILDEPTNGLDPRTQRWMLEALAQLAAAGKTIVTATHHLDTVSELAERVIVMNEAHTIAADGRPADILQDRQLLLAANLIDERYHVHLHGDDGHVHIHRHQPGPGAKHEHREKNECRPTNSAAPLKTS